MTIQCLLFDNDGTLVDSEYLCNLGIAEQFALLGVHLDVDTLVKSYRGGKLSEIFAEIACKNGVEIPSNFVPQYRKRVAALFDEKLAPIAGIKNALSRLHYTKAVVSNGPRAKVEYALSLCKLTHYFDQRVYSAYDVGIFKPNPEIYLYAARELGFKPYECVVVEDSITGVTAGSKANMLTLFYNVHNEPVNLPNVYSFSDMRKLPLLIEKLSTRAV